MIDVIIPYADYHRAIVDRAIASAANQSIPTHVIPVWDKHQRGAGWARNVGARQGTGLFLIFLDADDVLAPDAILHMLSFYTPGWYVYTDWQRGDGEIVTVPETTRDNGWYEGRIFHLITTLLPRALFEWVGGFDESLPAMEDTALYIELQNRGVCGKRCPYPVVTYHRELGKRSDTPLYKQLKEELRSRSIPMGCCDDSLPPPPVREPNDNEILAVALWSGNRSMVGPVTGDKYWGGNHKVMVVHKADAAARPGWWQPLIDPRTISPDVETVLDLLNKYGDSA